MRRPAVSGIDSMSNTSTGGGGISSLWFARRSEHGVAVDAVAQHAAAQLAERFLLDLADALAGEVEPLGEHLERLGLAVAQSVAPGEHLALALVQFFETDREQAL